ncbi:kelch-like protein 24 [Branchiostoma floridae]|uniref:Kelch-like protein 24 n=1 Tax=Branchiostoma floridae TaxID=7739 RepID=A0A9J7M3J3_BRAFL|nr:kelch-like protein 24 [Branchiostoma floridae]XP_035693534.1 kelch-like protein 24 [Branchiostoma floridae]
MMARTQASFDFCHNPHAGSLLQGLQELRSDNRLLDVSLCVAGKEIPCHRNVLAACSEYFCAMFCNGHRETKEYKVTINEVDSNALQLLVDYAYTSKVTITEHNAVELLEGANFFQIQPVRDACVTFISNNLSSDNCLQMMHVGNMLSCPDLEKKARLCALKEFAAVSKTPEFLSLTKDQLITLISSDDLNASEETVYTAVMAWINHDTRGRNQEMKELMELVRFPFMDKLYFLENVESNNTVCKTCQDIVLETRKYQLFPGEIQSPRTRPRRASGLKEAVVILGGMEKNNEGRPVYSHTITMTDSMEPSSSSWVPMTRMDKRICPNNPVAVLGTSDIIVSLDKEVWLYQPELNSWSKLAEMNSDRYFHGLAVLQGKVYAIGGRNNVLPALSSVEVYDRRQHKWTEGVPLPQPRYGHATAVLDDYIYVMGGFDIEKKRTSTVYRFSPGDSQWQPQRDAPVATCTSASVLNGSIYVAELQSCIFCFKPDDEGGLWSKVASGVPPCCGMTVFGTKLYICGGMGKRNGDVEGRTAVMCLDPETQSLSHVGTMDKGLCCHTCVTILKCC